MLPSFASKIKAKCQGTTPPVGHHIIRDVARPRQLGALRARFADCEHVACACVAARQRFVKYFSSFSMGTSHTMKRKASLPPIARYSRAYLHTGMRHAVHVLGRGSLRNSCRVVSSGDVVICVCWCRVAVRPFCQGVVRLFRPLFHLLEFVVDDGECRAHRVHRLHQRVNRL